ncbi:MAG: protein phosphatase 2C domain-containing protein [Deltaproteobacteria bacterium]|nr:protein phosphatase 2C domain-containing protein [Deltaproteobacteria bacterium]
MKVRVTSYWLPKAGNTQDEYEDAFYPKLSKKRQGKQLHFAIADGASESMLSGKWAEILVKKFCKLKASRMDFGDFLEKAYKTWNFWKRNYFDEREKCNKPIQWYEEMGLQAGAFSTLLGLTLIGFEEKSYGEWKAIAVGDSCLLQVRKECLIHKFPIQNSSDFNNRPFLICSDPARNNKILEVLKITSGDLHFGDQLYLMTDSLACWFLERYENEQAPWSFLRGLDINGTQRPFELWITELRARKEIRNDDVTLIRIDIN